MRVQINAPSQGRYNEATKSRDFKYARDKAGQPTRQAFLVSVLDSVGVDPSMLAFDTFDTRTGQPIPSTALRGAYEMWFDIADANKIVAKLDSLSGNSILAFEFTASFGPTYRGAHADGSGANEGVVYQTITIGSDRFQPRKFSVMEAPGIEGLD
jgi:hypothetical protein